MEGCRRDWGCTDFFRAALCAQLCPSARRARAAIPLSMVNQIGRALLTEFVFPFEIISVLLTVAIIGAIALARDLPEDKAMHKANTTLEEGK